MKINPTQLLIDEHEIIKQAESAAKSMETLLGNDEEKYGQLLDKMLHFFKEYSDSFHHHKEEIILFPELMDHPDFKLKEIIDEMLEHHEMFREYANEIREYAAEKDYKAAHKVLKRYIGDLLDHIAVEDDELFIMAENLFTERELESIYFRFKDTDMQLGEEAKKKLAKIPAEILSELLKKEA